MAYVPTFGDNLDFLQGNRDEPGGSNVVQLTSGSSSAVPGGAQGVSSPAASPGSSTPPLGSAPDVGSSAGFGTSGALFDRLFSPIQTGVEKERGVLGGVVEDFRSEAGPSRTFGSVGGEDVLGSAIEGRGDLGRAKELVGSRYEGPGGLAPETVAGIQGSLDQLRARAGALGSGAGLQTVIQESSPGLSAGSARYEAQRRISDPGFRSQRAQSMGSLRELAADLRREREQAESFAAQRQEEEQSIADRSRDYLLGRREDVSGEIQSQLDAAQAEQQRAADAYRQFTETGNVDALRGAGDSVLGFNVDEFDTPTQKALRDSRAAYDEILSRYDDIADMPVRQLTAGRRGLQQNDALTREEIETLRERGLNQGEIRGIRNRVRERQRELEGLFGPENLTPRAEQGEFGLVRPLYFTENPGEDTIQTPDARNYVGFDPGMSPARSNVSTEDQAALFDRIQEVLGEIDRIGDTEPLRAAYIGAELGAFLESEELALENQQGRLEESRLNWKRQLRRLRKDYKKKKKAKKWGKIGGWGELAFGGSFITPILGADQSLGGKTSAAFMA